MRAKWSEDHRLDLGILGEVRVYEMQGFQGEWTWRWRADGGPHYPAPDKAQRGAEVFVRRALKQAQRRCP